MKLTHFSILIFSTYALTACGGKDSDTAEGVETSTSDAGEGEGSNSGLIPTASIGCDVSTATGVCYQEPDNDFWADHCSDELPAEFEPVEQPCPEDGIIGACVGMSEVASYTGLNTTIFCYNDFCWAQMQAECESNGGTLVQ